LIPSAAVPRRAGTRKGAGAFLFALGAFAALSLFVPAGQNGEGSRTAKNTAALTTPVNISHSSSPSGNPLVGVDANGAAYAVWYEYQPGRVFYFATNKSGAWSTPYQFERLHYDVEEAGFPALAVSQSGVCHLIFQDGRETSYDIYHLAYDSGWSSAVNVSDNEGGSAYGGVAVNPLDNAAYVVWQDGTGRTQGWDNDFRARSASGSWGARQTLPLGDGYMPKIAVDGSGTAHMVWGTGWGTTIWYAKNRTPLNAASWTQPTLIKWDVREDWSYPKIAADSAGNAYIIWMDGTRGNDEIFLVKITSDGTVSSETNVSQSAASSTDAALAVDRSNGNIYVAWVENGDIYFNMYDGSWSGPQNLTSSAAPSGMPSLAVDPSGTVHLVYQEESGGNYEIFYAAVSAGPAQPSIRVLSPNGGETWAPGSSHEITWTTRGTQTANVRIELSTNGGASYADVVASTPNDGTHSWTVPNSLSTTCLVRITDAGNAGLTDTSDSYFSIGTPPPPPPPPPPPTGITVVSPNGGEAWQAFTTQQIAWTTQGTIGPVRIELTTDGGASFSDIVASTPNNGSYAWVVPNTPSPACGVRISQASTGSPSDTSNAVFTITPPPRAEPPIGLILATRLAADAASKINTLGWLDNPENRNIGLQSYRIFRKPSDAPDSAFALIASVSPQTHVLEDANLPFSRKFTYGMTALGTNGLESNSSEFVTEISVFPPLNGAVTTVVNSSLFKKETLNVVSWQENPLNIPAGVVRYNIYRKKADQDDSKFAKIAWVVSSVFEYRDRKLAAGSDFVYSLTAVDSGGTESAPFTVIRVGN
jgi:hypothetical protein